MLKEKILYSEGLPVKIYVTAIEEYPIHFHDELEVIYVLDGTVKVKDGYYNYSLNKDDVLIINDRELHSIKRTREPNIILIFQIDLQFFSKFHSTLSNPFFVTDTSYNVDESKEPLEKLRRLMAIIMMEYINKAVGYKNRIIDYTNEFITGLNNDFQYFSMDEGKFVNEMKNKGNKILAERVHRITDYIYKNYDRKLTLQEIANKEHLSVYYLSHVIKESMGLSFQDFLNFVRVEQSEQLLLGTDKKISDISFECGFSATRYFIKYFTKWFGCHPEEYRKKYVKKIMGKEPDIKISSYSPESILSILKNRFRKEYTDYQNENERSLKVIEADVNREGKNNSIKCPFDTYLIKNTAEYLYVEEFRKLKEIFRDLKIEKVSVPLNIIVDAIALRNIMDFGIDVEIFFEYPTNNKNFDDIINSLERISREYPESDKIKFFMMADKGNSENSKKMISQIKENMKMLLNIKLKDQIPLVENNYLYDSVLMIPIILRGALDSCEDKKFRELCSDVYPNIFLTGEPGIVTSYGIKKPAYFAYKMLAELEGEEIAKGEGYIIIKEGTIVKILLYAPGGADILDQKVKSPDEIISIIENSQTDYQMIVKLKEMKGCYQVKRYKINKNNCILTLYSGLGFPDSLTLEEEQMIKWASYPDVSIKEMLPDNGVLEIHSDIGKFSAELIIIGPY